jgi:Tol biopolymer transport system component
MRRLNVMGALAGTGRGGAPRARASSPSDGAGSPGGSSMARRKVMPAAALVLAVAGVLGGPASQARPMAPASNGLIAYVRDVGRHAQLFTVRPDGSGERQLTRLDGNASAPHWSPGGDRIVFAVEHERYCSVEIVNADGSGLTDLIDDHKGCLTGPSFTPDGQRIVFECFDDVNDVDTICSADASGGDRRPLFPPTHKGVAAPVVSPDGGLVTFLRGPALFAVRSDGSGMRRLTPDSWDILDKYDWSPDGTRILVSTHHTHTRLSANLITIKPDGSGMKRLTHFTGGRTKAYAGSYSPDGKHIVFRLEQGNKLDQGNKLKKGNKAALATVDPDGRNLHLLTKLGTTKPRYIAWGTHAP